MIKGVLKIGHRRLLATTKAWVIWCEGVEFVGEVTHQIAKHMG